MIETEAEKKWWMKKRNTKLSLSEIRKRRILL